MKTPQNVTATAADHDGNVIHGAFEASYSVKDLADEPGCGRKLAQRTGYGSSGLLSMTSPFPDLGNLWLKELAGRDIANNTKDNYRDALRVHAMPFFENYTLGEITTGRVETFLQQQYAVSYSMATLPHPAEPAVQVRHPQRRDGPQPGGGHLPAGQAEGKPQALTPEQILAIREAANEWRTGPGVRGPKPIRCAHPR